MKDWKKNYSPSSSDLWKGRTGDGNSLYFFQHIKLINLLHDIPQYTDSNPGFALLGFACDEGVKRNQGRVGAARGPNACRQALATMALPQKCDFSCYDVGDIVCNNNDLEMAQHHLAEVVSLLFTKGFYPIVLGGGHELAWGHYQGIAKSLPNQAIRLINFDAHFDMRPLIEGQFTSSGTSFLQIAQACKNKNLPFHYHCFGIQPWANNPALFATAEAWNVKTVIAERFHLNYQREIAQMMQFILQQPEPIYLTICLDVFAHAFAPGVSAPQALGLNPWHVIPLLRELARSGKVISFSLAELAPALDRDNITAKLAASLILELMLGTTSPICFMPSTTYY